MERFVLVHIIFLAQYSNKSAFFDVFHKGVWGMFDETLKLFESNDFYATMYSCVFTCAVGYLIIYIMMPIEKYVILNKRVEAFLDSHPVVDFLVEMTFYWIVFLGMNGVWRGVWNVSNSSLNKDLYYKFEQ